MKSSTLVFKSLIFYRRTHLSVLAGAALASAVLVGALVVGDSVRYSLRRLALARLGTVRLALASPDRFVRAELAGEMARALGAEAAPVMQLSGIAAAPESGARANGVQILGIDDRFWRMGEVAGPFPDLADERAAVNRQLAAKLALQVGDEFVVRAGRPSYLPIEAPFATETGSTVSMRVRVVEILGEERFGRFSLAANQAAPLSVFLPMEYLSKRMERGGMANVILLSGKEGRTLSAAEADRALEQHWRPADAGISFRRAGGEGVTELRSGRVFIDPLIAAGALAAPYRPEGVLSYFVNELRRGDRSTPYSVVSAPGDDMLARIAGRGGLRDDEIVINEWLARDLAATPGDALELKYYVLGDGGKLAERSSSFTIASVAPISGAAADRTLMPEFPGVAAAETTRDWDPGFPVDFSSIRREDEDYWYEYRGTPKAFVTLAAAQEMWHNRFGAFTAVRFRDDSAAPGAVADSIMAALRPASLGLQFSDAREAALRAASQGVDFGQLFIGLSMFLMIAALLLTGLLFVFAVQQRAGETATLLAVGFTPSRVRRLLLAEGAMVAAIGAAAGAILGVAYNQVVLHALNTIWRSAVGTSALRIDIRPTTLLVGALCGFALAVAVMWLAVRRQAVGGVAQPQLLFAGEPTAPGRKRAWAGGVVAAVCAAAAVIVVSLASRGRTRQAAGAFFASGWLLLVGSLAIWDALLIRLARSAREETLTIAALALRNCARRRWRSLAAIAMLACGVFLVIAVGANRRDPLADASRRSSGTGAFALWAETALPVLSDLNTAADRRKHGLESALFENVRFVNMRLRKGDDASCLNLNRTINPAILAVDPKEPAERGAFTFVNTSLDAAGQSPWLLLERDLGPGIVPAVADESVIVWGLGKRLGDTLSYTDEQGRPFKLKLVAGLADSVFQGSVIISGDAFLKRFPSIGGARVFLIDVPGGQAGAVSGALSRALEDFGIDIVPTARRLADFSAVQNTYLTIFLALGGLGLLLGSAGMGVVVLRNVLERRGELALARAVGFSRTAVMKMLLWEHWILLAAGTACGAISAGVAVLPALGSPGAVVPYAGTAAVLAAVVASGGAWVYAATRIALRGDLLAALRDE